MFLSMLNLFFVAMLKKQKTGSTPTVKLDKLDIAPAPTVIVPLVKDVDFVESSCSCSYRTSGPSCRES
jgi:hypothetical protein